MSTPQTPARMSDEEIVTEMRALREDLDRTARRLMELSQLLASRVAVARRAGDLTASALHSYAGAWTRVAGMIGSATRRTVMGDRLLEVAKKRSEQEKEKQVAREQRQERVAQKQEQPQWLRNLGVSEAAGDLMELYGKEVVNALGR